MATVAHAAPFERFREVYDRAVAAGMENPNAATLATVTADGRPSVRAVLVKGFDEEGFVFYTNLTSRKGRHLLARPVAALHCYWRELAEQISVEGTVRVVDAEEADAYFATRPRTSQLGAWASKQSQPLSGRPHLLARVARYEGRFVGRPVPRPPHWTGFRLTPDRFEFWVQGAFRLHDRTLFERIPEGWRTSKLYP